MKPTRENSGLPEVSAQMRTTFEDNEVEMIMYADGSAALSRHYAEHFVYLYPAQVAALRAFFNT